MDSGDEPAFPVSWEEGGSMVADPGMNIRDYFAGQALSTIDLDKYRDKHDTIREVKLSRHLYEIADAMLEERGGE